MEMVNSIRIGHELLRFLQPSLQISSKIAVNKDESFGIEFLVQLPDASIFIPNPVFRAVYLL